MAQEFDPAGHSPDRPHDDAALTTPVAVAPAHSSPPPTSPPEPIRHSPFPALMSLLMIGTLAAAWFISRQKEEPAAAPATAADTKPAEDKKSDGASTPIEEPKDLKGDVAALTKRIDTLQAKLDGLPKADSAADLKPLEEKVAHLAKVPDLVAPLPKKLDDLDGRIGSMGKDLDGLKAEVAALKKTPEPAATAAPAPADVDVAGQAMGQAVDLFKKGKYKEAADAFRKLSQDEGNDARVWYYAALANGLASGKWTGDTTTFVKKGIEREKAGSPAPDKIDAVFTDLTAQTGKDWLAGYRKQAH